MECRCRSLDRLDGAEAASYAQEHLRLLSVDHDTWDAAYECPSTGVKWTEHYPQSELHGGGPPVLTRDSG
jgi:hypothetical protein